MARFSANLAKSVIDQSDSILRPIATDFAQKTFKKSQDQLIEDFLAHPVSQEIEEGTSHNPGSKGSPSGENKSGTLSQGNLFSFIGFEESENPVAETATFLKENTNLGEGKKTNSKGVVYQFPIYGPTRGELSEKTQLPWETGRSWLYGIEEGISGFGNYLVGLFKASRSGGGIQARNKVRSSVFQTRDYFSGMFDKFKKSFQ